jgi:hypothetical protein
VVFFFWGGATFMIMEKVLVNDTGITQVQSSKICL